MAEQLAFTFVAEMEQQREEAEGAEQRRMQRANDIAILRATVRQYPLTDFERSVIPKGVRPARFVISWECEKCPYAYEDHSLGNRWIYRRPGRIYVVCICLKDYYEKGYGDKDHA